MKKTLITFVYLAVILTTAPLHADTQNTESTCYGTTKEGRLENAVKLPDSGKNFVAYSSLGVFLGRTYVHSLVRDAVLAAFESLEKSHPDTVYMYGETGLRNGGVFKPHKTHQNGLSVDFMVPVLDKQHQSVPLPTSLFNKFGYGIEFDDQGRYEGLSIDFEAMASHIKALHLAALDRGLGIKRVIFDPKLQPYLYKTRDGEYIKQHIIIPQKRSWVRHDEHYHVDFDLKCEPL